jgi:hypothetical protein
VRCYTICELAACGLEEELDGAELLQTCVSIQAPYYPVFGPAPFRCAPGLCLPFCASDSIQRHSIPRIFICFRPAWFAAHHESSTSFVTYHDLPCFSALLSLWLFWLLHHGNPPFTLAPRPLARYYFWPPPAAHPRAMFCSSTRFNSPSSHLEDGLSVTPFHRHCKMLVKFTRRL